MGRFHDKGPRKMVKVKMVIMMELLYQAGNGWKWLEMPGNGWKFLKWMNMAEHGWKWLKTGLK